MGVLAPRLRTLEGSACPPIDTSSNFPVHVSAESHLNISPNLSEVISEVSEPYDNFWLESFNFYELGAQEQFRNLTTIFENTLLVPTNI